MSIAAIVLAAGYSRRLGRPKQEVVLGSMTLLQRAIRTAQGAQLTPRVVVVRPGLAQVEAPDTQIVVNDQAEEGMASSVRSGIAALGTGVVTGAVILTCDQPLLRPEHLRALCANPHRITGSAYAGRVGVPAYFPAATFAALSQLQGDTGARTLLRTAFAIPEENLALDIDTEEDLRYAERRFTSSEDV